MKRLPSYIEVAVLAGFIVGMLTCNLWFAAAAAILAGDLASDYE